MMCFLECSTVCWTLREGLFGVREEGDNFRVLQFDFVCLFGNDNKSVTIDHFKSVNYVVWTIVVFVLTILNT